MGGSQSPVLANIIITEFEQTVVKPLIDRKLITFYCRYVDDTLLLIKPDTIDVILDYFHKFDKNIRFTYDLFENITPHFLDINSLPSGIGKDTFSGQYTNFDSFVPWRHKISWIRALVDRIHRICSPNMVKLELKLLKNITSWNGFPSRISHTLIRRFSSNALNKNHTTANNFKDKDEPVAIWLSIPIYIGKKTSQILRFFKRKLRRHLKNPNTQFRIREKTTKLCFYTNNKDKVPLLNKSHVVYKFICPGCQSSYIGKTDRTLLTRTREHAVTDIESAIYIIYARPNI